MRFTMIQNAIGKDLTQVKKIEVIKKDAELFSVLTSMQTYTEGEYKSRTDLEKGMRKLSQYIDKAIEIWLK